MTVTTILAAAAVLLAIVIALTYLLPRRVRVERTAFVDAPPATILALAASSEGFQTFNPYRTADPELKIAAFGPEHGVGAGFRFEGRDGKGTQTVTAVTDRSVTYAIDLGAMGQPTQEIIAEPEGTGARVTWRVDSDLGLNPVFRVFGLFMDRMIGGTYEQGLENLGSATA